MIVAELKTRMMTKTKIQSKTSGIISRLLAMTTTMLMTIVLEASFPLIEPCGRRSVCDGY